MSKESFYFSHDSNARNDVKILKLRRKLGLEGYGIYWCLVEMLRDAPNNQLPIESLDDIAFSLNTEKSKLDLVINDFDLFTIENDHFFSQRLIRNMTQYKLLKESKSSAGKVGMRNRWSKNSQQNKMVL